MKFTFLFFAALVFSQDEIITSTAIRNIYLAGTCERAGSLSFRIQSDAFPSASSEKPVYICLELAPALSLCQTLVDLVDSPIGHHPIQLAIYESRLEGETEIVAPANSVELVRWRAGEHQIWLKIQSSTSKWLSKQDQYMAPNEANSVQLLLGLDQTEWRGIAAEGAHEGSLPWNQLADGTLATTEIRLNPSTNPDLAELLNIALDVAQFDESTTGVENSESIHPGRVLELPRWIGLGPIALLSNQREFSHYALLPWVSWNDRYQSEITFSNASAVPSILELSARRADQSTARTEVTLSAWQSKKLDPSQLFPEFGQGDGFSLLVRSSEASVRVGLVTYLRSGRSGHSPALSEAIAWESGKASLGSNRGAALELSSFPAATNFFTGLVITNLGTSAIDAKLLLLDEAGSLIGEALELTHLESFEPRALLIRDLVPAGVIPSRAFVLAKAGEIAALGFVFDEAGEPAMVLAQRFEWPIPALQPMKQETSPNKAQ